MPLEFQRRVTAAVQAALPGCVVSEKPQTPEWLVRPGLHECGTAWDLVQQIYGDLTGLALPTTMPPRESRRLDAVITDINGTRRILEVDEVQHFNEFRARTLEQYPPTLRTAFKTEEWLARSRAKTRLEGGGFAKPRPPLFPGDAGRHRQRAYRDMLADVLPEQYGWAPTLRVGYFELEGITPQPDDVPTVATILATKGLTS